MPFEPKDFWGKIDIRGDDECWEYLPLAGTKRYGRFAGMPATKVALLLSGHPAPDGMVIMHSCDNPPCCNPAHLRAGTQKENLADAFAKRRWRGNGWHTKTHCKYGHEFTEENTLLNPRGHRRCRTCVKGIKRRHAQRKRDALREYLALMK